MKYDYLIVGAGLFGAVFAYEATQKEKKCLVIDKRDHIGGNIYTYEEAGIQVHKYGAHIFHTSDEKVWNYINRFTAFNRFTNSPMARYGNKLYNMPFNMNTFYQLWGVTTPGEAKAEIARQVKEAGITEPKNLEEQAISMVGKDIYEILVKGYTAKQWGRPCAELPAFIIKRLPVRFTFDNNYFNDLHQGIPVEGYTAIVEKMLKGSEVKLGCDFFANRAELEAMADRIVFTGMIDQYYNYCYGELEYRGLHFETETLDTDNFQGNAVINYNEYEVPYTRIIEHKHFTFGTQEKTVITREYPAKWERGQEPYYPVNNDENNALYGKYRALADKESRIIFGGRLGQYKYYDMHQVIAAALSCAQQELG